MTGNANTAVVKTWGAWGTADATATLYIPATAGRATIQSSGNDALLAHTAGAAKLFGTWVPDGDLIRSQSGIIVARYGVLWALAKAGELLIAGDKAIKITNLDDPTPENVNEYVRTKVRSNSEYYISSDWQRYSNANHALWRLVHGDGLMLKAYVPAYAKGYTDADAIRVILKIAAAMYDIGPLAYSTPDEYEGLLAHSFEAFRGEVKDYALRPNAGVEYYAMHDGQPFARQRAVGGRERRIAMTTVNVEKIELLEVGTKVANKDGSDVTWVTPWNKHGLSQDVSQGMRVVVTEG